MQVENFRETARGRIEPFFVFQVDAAAFSGAPKTYFLGINSKNIDEDKRTISALTGPHVVYVDTRAILEQARTISDQILAVLSLFLAFVTGFAILTTLTLF